MSAGMERPNVLLICTDHWSGSLLGAAGHPVVMTPTKADARLGAGTQDDRLAEFADLMPTLLDLAGVEIPTHVDRLSLAGSQRRQTSTVSTARGWRPCACCAPSSTS
tara:strand:- start:77 stop:397 length:321 start_codon:yes stop_codon:yes gene_type:complete